MRSKSQRRADNNDGMDPDWKPEFPPDKPNKIDDLFVAIQYLSNVLKPLNLKTKDNLRVTMNGQKWDAIITAFEALK